MWLSSWRYFQFVCEQRIQWNKILIGAELEQNVNQTMQTIIIRNWYKF